MFIRTTIKGSVDENDILTLTDSQGNTQQVPVQILQDYMKGMKPNEIEIKIYNLAIILTSFGINPNDISELKNILNSSPIDMEY